MLLEEGLCKVHEVGNNLVVGVCPEGCELKTTACLLNLLLAVSLLDGTDTGGIRVILAGLDRDFRGLSFGAMSDLLIHAEFVTKLSAVCNKCGNPATRTQRIIDGKPAHYKDPTILVGAIESYEPRCRHCHEVLGAPKIKLKKV